VSNPYKVLSSREVYRNPWIRLREDMVVRPGGDQGGFAVVEMKAGASVLPVDDDLSVYLVREFKYALGRYSLEVVSGGIDPGEEPLDAARRELREEAGLEASEWISMGGLDPLSTAVYCPIHLFLSRGLRHGPSNPDSGEVLHVERMPLERAVRMVIDGEITHAASCVLLLKADRHLRQPAVTDDHIVL
jgi:ADP-ribose pyrophosphatase